MTDSVIAAKTKIEVDYEAFEMAYRTYMQEYIALARGIAFAILLDETIAEITETLRRKNMA